MEYSAPQLLDPQAFEGTQDGVALGLFTLRNRDGITVQLTNYGARVVSLWLPDRDGKWQDVVLGYDTLAKYQEKKNHYGATVGPYANRIGGAKFTIDGTEYKLDANEGPNCLHGGSAGFKVQAWKTTVLNEQQVLMQHTSPDGLAGFPGNVSVRLIYSLTDDNELQIDYEATTDAATHVSLTHHSYFNLLGAGIGSIDDHVLQVRANAYLPTVAGIPTGEAPVDGTPMDLRQGQALRIGLESDFEPITSGGNYDHNFVLDPAADNWVAEIYEPTSGRAMAVYTNQPGMQVFTTPKSLPTDHGKYGQTYEGHAAFCLETQSFPNSPNEPGFPSTLLRAGETYQATCRYRFGLKEVK